MDEPASTRLMLVAASLTIFSRIKHLTSNRPRTPGSATDAHGHHLSVLIDAIAHIHAYPAAQHGVPAHRNLAQRRRIKQWDSILFFLAPLWGPIHHAGKV